MWKYQCGRHLLSLLIGGVVGMLLFGSSINEETISWSVEVLNWLPEATVRSALSMSWLLGALIGASALNGVLLLIYLVQKFNISPMVLFLLFFLAPSFALILAVGALLLIPTIIVCIYGMIASRNAAAKNFRSLPNGNGNEVERVYRLHHAFKEDVSALALKCRKESDRWTAIYVLGLIALVCLTLIIQNLMVMFIVFLVYALLLTYLFRLRAQSLLPINALLFEQCDPIACASAILIFSRRGNRLNLKMNMLFAQCMLYLDDPQLAMDSLVLMRRGNSAAELNYQSLMAEANYRLGDQSALERNLEAVKSTKVNIGAAGNLMMQDTIAAIQNKIDLMNQHFDQCEAYYRKVLPQMKLRFQLVDAHYYLGMITFVRRNFDEAGEHFNYVVTNGNTMSYRERAQRYLDMIQRHIEAAAE